MHVSSASGARLQSLNCKPRKVDASATPSLKFDQKAPVRLCTTMSSRISATFGRARPPVEVRALTNDGPVLRKSADGASV